MALHVLAYNLTRITNIMGVQQGVFTLPRPPEGISRRFSLPVRLGDRVRVSFVALKSGHVSTVYFPTVAIRHLRIAAIIGRSKVEHLRYLLSTTERIS